VFYFKLFDDSKLVGFSISEKHKIINIAVKLSRSDFPLNLSKRLAILAGVVFLPAIILYLNFGFTPATLWALFSITLLEFKMASIETPAIKMYIDTAIVAFQEKT
jgi:hypothetical protein